MVPLKLAFDGEHPFVAVVLTGHRLWVCVRPAGAAVTAGWSGCWSRDGGVARADPTGPYLREHLFFDGWDFWGNGTPAPLAGWAPADLVAGAEECASGADLAARLTSCTD
ncbi:hypothetical protein [Paractinoplanes atraurantiacus]|uniref:Uncharacterized protein n=1 Tax=Paractinoplanes atraurantiacus TaxID=1036182 RepID=A0A285K5J7_9ACTN|nr:hypothetical protein [Actinoplanes atraurantiacus]SNY66601.1 hypothetical protein SAMN05421748_13075 [Actinoplanes atraurantiacus]